MYSKKLLEKFKNIKLETTDQNLLDSISLNNIFNNNEIDNSFKISEKEINKESFNLNNNTSINNQINSNPVNFPSQNNIQNNIKSSLFQPQNNNMNIGNIYNNNYSGILPNSQSDLFRNKIPSIPNNLNNFYPGPKPIPNNFGNEIRPNLFGELDNKNNLETPNIPYFHIPLQNPISMTQMQTNIIPNSIPSNFLITNNTNINTNSNININKNINNIINFNNKNVINTNVNNNININTITEPKNLMFPNNNSLNPNIKNENNININNNKEINSNVKNTPKIIFSSTNCNNNNTTTNNNKIEQQQKKSIDDANLPTKKPTPLFNIKESSSIKEKLQKAQLTSKKRKRFIKNNKLVFVQVDKETNKKEENNKEKNESEENEENNNEESLNSEKVSELMQKNTKPRGSRYRGVSKNGSQWQVLIMVKKKKRYLGSFSNEEEAARAYDRVALQHHGIKAKTNYDYTKEEVKEIMEGPKLLNID